MKLKLVTYPLYDNITIIILERTLISQYFDLVISQTVSKNAVMLLKKLLTDNWNAICFRVFLIKVS